MRGPQKSARTPAVPSFVFKCSTYGPIRRKHLMSESRIRRVENRFLEEIATELNDPQRIHAEINRSSGGGGLQIPSTASLSTTEKMVFDAWVEITGEYPAFDVGFVEQGGDSLLAMQIVSRLTHLYKVEVPITTLLEESPSPRQFAQLLRDIIRTTCKGVDDSQEIPA